MKTYTVHMHNLSGDAEQQAAEAVFVREGFSFWALLFPLIWLIVNRMWLVLGGYLVLVIALESLSLLVGEIVPGVFVATLSLIIGFEAGQLRRWTLGRKGYRTIGIAAGRDLAEAERRFFDSWIAKAKAQPAPPPREPKRYTFTGERPVAGLFPQPGYPK